MNNYRENAKEISSFLISYHLLVPQDKEKEMKIISFLRTNLFQTKVQRMKGIPKEINAVMESQVMGEKEKEKIPWEGEFL